MRIEKTDKEILIRTPSSTDIIGVQPLLDYIQFREVASKSKVTDEQINELANKSKFDFWESNKPQFIG